MQPSRQLEVLQAHVGGEFTATPSPFMQWLNPIVISAEKGRLTFQYTVRREMTNPMGTLHGGVSAAIIDDIIGAAMFSLNEHYFYTTINNVIDYLAAAREGDTLLADAFIIKKGNRIVNAQCEIWNADRSRMIARGYSNLLRTDIEK